MKRSEEQIKYAISRITGALDDALSCNELYVEYMVLDNNIYIKCYASDPKQVIEYLFEWQNDIDYITRSLGFFKIKIKKNDIILKAI